MRKLLFITVLFFMSHKAYADSYCLVDQSGKVVNVVSWDGVQPYTPPDGLTLVACPTQGIGWTYIDGAWVAPSE